MGRRARERGAAAVEFAIVFPILIIVLAGIVDFGRAFYTQIVLTNAAREGVRLVALESEASLPTRMTASSFGMAVSYSVAQTCVGQNGTVLGKLTVTPGSPFEWIFLDDILTVIPGGTSWADPVLDATGTMRCTG